jgi:Arc-like DNA binding domain
MPAILLKNVPKELKDEIQREAERNRRSMHQQIMLTLEQAFGFVPPIRLPKPVKPLKPVTAKMIRDGIHEGRE